MSIMRVADSAAHVFYVGGFLFLVLERAIRIPVELHQPSRNTIYDICMTRAIRGLQD